MEHIKGQVRLGDYHSLAFVYPIWDTDGEAIACVDAKQLGRERASNIAAEIVHAINAYDPLIVQRNDLLAQRDELVAALEMTTFELDSIIDQKGHTGRTRGIRDIGYAVLDLVKGGTSE